MSLIKKRGIIAGGIIMALCISMFGGCGNKNTEESSSKAIESSSVAQSEETQDESIQTPKNTGRLSVSGTQLVGEDGKPVQLRGISTHGLAWFPDYVNNEAFKEFRQTWGANVMRLAMYTAENGGYCTGGDKEKLMGIVENGVKYATDNDMYVIIDWHVLNDNNPNVHKSEAIKFWDSISKKYANNNNVIYEICNEPCGNTTWDDIKTYANDVIPVIRENDKNAVIVVGTPTWSQEVDKAADSPLTGFDNIMYTLHFYAATHKEDLQRKMIAAYDKGLPIMVTEFGICDASGNGAIDEESADKWVSLMNERGISYVCWNLSNKNESSALIKAGVSIVSGFGIDDLSQEGKWLYNLLSTSAKKTGGLTPITPAGDNKNSTAENTSSNGGNTTISGTDKSYTSGQFQISIRPNGNWESEGKKFYQFVGTITNNGNSDVNSWEVTIPFDGVVTLKDGWNGNYSASGNNLIISNKDYNGKIMAGQSVTDVGFVIGIG